MRMRSFASQTGKSAHTDEGTIKQAMAVFTIDDAQALILQQGSTIVVPAQNAAGETYTSIAANAFAGTPITSAVLPDSIQTIGDSAFAFTPLLQLALGNGVQSIGSSAFRNTGLTGVALPSSTLTIGEGAFAGNPSLSSLQLANGLQSIGASAFSGTSLTHVAIPNTVLSIGDSAFANNVQLSDLSLGSGVQSIGASAFINAAITTLQIPNSTLTIGDSAFANNPALAHLTLGSGLEVIGTSAFRNAGLSSIHLPLHVGFIGDYAFENNPLTSITFEQGIGSRLLSIGTGSFTATPMQPVLLPQNLKTVADGNFPLGTVSAPNGASIGQGPQTVLSISPPSINNQFYLIGEQQAIQYPLEIPATATSVRLLEPIPAESGTFTFTPFGNYEFAFVPAASYEALNNGDTASTGFQYLVGDANGYESVATVQIDLYGINAKWQPKPPASQPNGHTETPPTDFGTSPDVATAVAEVAGVEAALDPMPLIDAPSEPRGAITSNDPSTPLVGTAANDVLIPLTPGAYSITGMKGADLFVFSVDEARTPVNADYIMDYSFKEGDQIGLDTDIFRINQIRFKAVKNHKQARKHYNKKTNLIFNTANNELIIDLNSNRRGLGGGGSLAYVMNGAKLSAASFELLQESPSSETFF